MLHISELADHKVENPEEVVKVGDEIEVKILRVDTEERKIGLSRKRVEWAEEEEAAAGGGRPVARPGHQAAPGTQRRPGRFRSADQAAGTRLGGTRRGGSTAAAEEAPAEPAAGGTRAGGRGSERKGPVIPVLTKPRQASSDAADAA